MYGTNHNGQEFIGSESLFVRQLVIDELVSQFYNLIRVSKKVFYSFLIDDCYDLLIVKLMWESLYQCIRNPDIVLSNSRISLDMIQILPASQYVLTEPVYSAVLRLRHEPIWFYQIFLTQPSFAFPSWVHGKRSKKPNPIWDAPTYLEWKQFLRFIQKQIAKYPVLKSDRKYYSNISTEFEYIKECGFDSDQIIKIVYLDESIPVGSVKVLQSIESSTILKQMLNKNGKNSAEICCNTNDLFSSVQYRILEEMFWILLWEFKKTNFHN
ncbi:predicted protein [Naegleria gruberi]|uniref:Predicted protein n=1 Tax=Naegleria gruberi TaxID=5762 RepID=D2V3M6_NAEGR|nr:uncharacterized protein NAEGRDRAFT_63419 [Naegleria gruberi]EFC48798.1 predicted protein [Naegleria gruberi]|eukprot:XP_002681542.1 predicted protein [Naegleria gruberi strain NEG-M]